MANGIASSPDHRLSREISATVLIIDDEIQPTDAIVQCLRLNGFLVECTHTGADGLARAAAARPNVVVLDLRLPDILGLTVLSELRRGQIGASVVVLTGAFLDDDHEVAARALGAAIYARKPILDDELSAAVRTATALPPPEIAAPLVHNDGVNSPPVRGHVSDPTSALHARVLQGDTSAAEEMATFLVPAMQQRLRRKWPAIERGALHDAAVDAVIHYLQHPNLFDVARAVPLEAFIQGVAHRKLRDRIKADAARLQREQEWSHQRMGQSRDPEARVIAADLRVHLEKLTDSASEIRAVRRWLVGDEQTLTTAMLKRLKDRIRLRARKLFVVRDRKRGHAS